MHPRLIQLLLALILAVPAPLLAQEANTTPSAVEPGPYVVDPSHTQVHFDVLHMGFSYYEGRFTNVSGDLDLRPADVSGSSVTIIVPVAAVSTTSAKLDDELKSADWLDAAKFPTMTFKSTAVKPNGEGEADVLGNLTLHGVTKPLTLHVKFVGSGINPLDKRYTAGFAISGTLKRSDFGVPRYVPMIGDDVDMEINGAFEKK